MLVSATGVRRASPTGRLLRPASLRRCWNRAAIAEAVRERRPVWLGDPRGEKEPCKGRAAILPSTAWPPAPPQPPGLKVGI